MLRIKMAVFRAIAENIGRTEKFQTFEKMSYTNRSTRGASSDTRGRCAPPLDAASLLHVRGADDPCRFSAGGQRVFKPLIHAHLR